jgi:hypothetical protein
MSLLAVVHLVACAQRPAAEVPADGGLAPHLAARVNGTPITHFEVVLRLRTMPTASPEEARDAVVLDELRAQRARALGLDKDPAFLEELARIEAQAAEVRRKELARLLVHREILRQAEPSDDDVRTAFEKHRARYAHRYTVLQLVLRDEQALQVVKSRLAEGVDFEALVLDRVGPERTSLEELRVGPLGWDEVPPAWWPELDRLDVGGVSDVIRAPGSAPLLLKLVAREPAPEPTLEQVAPRLRAALTAERAEALKTASDAALREGASVILAPLRRPD